MENSYEIALLLSCPEVARLALLNKELMAFGNVEVNDEYFVGAKRLSTELNVKREEHRYFWDIRISSIDILQNRNFYIVNRVVLLSMIYIKIQKCIDEKNYSNIPIEIEKFMNSVIVMSSEDFKNLSGKLDVQINLYKNILSFLDEKFDVDF